MARLIVVRRNLTVLKACAAAITGFALTWAWAATILHTDAQAAIGFLGYLPLVPGLVGFLLAFVEHRPLALRGLAVTAALGATVAAFFWSRGAGALPCLATAFAILSIVGLVGAALGYRVSRRFYSIASSDGVHCLNCGYSLVGLACDRCPECGDEIDFAALGTSAADLRAMAKGTQTSRTAGVAAERPASGDTGSP